MSCRDKFIIENNILKRYIGNGGKVVIPKGVTEIEDSAFHWCHKVTEIVLPFTVVRIGRGAFAYCNNLEQINLDGAIGIESEAFKGCEKLADKDGFIIYDSVLHSYCGEGGSVVIPQGVTYIEEKAFFECERITDITIPDTVTAIGDEAFAYCHGLKRIWLPESVAEIGNRAFFRAYALNEVTVAGVNTAIGDEAFYCCDSLAAVNVTGSVRNVGASAFHGCKNLCDVTLRGNIKRIENGAFSYCTSLKKVELSGSVLSIDNHAFAWCNSLEEVILPDYIESIDNMAFGMCLELIRINFPPTVTYISQFAFPGCLRLRQILFPTDITEFDGTFLEVLWNGLYNNHCKIPLMLSFMDSAPDSVIYNPSIINKIKANKAIIADSALAEDNSFILVRLFSMYKSISLDELECYINEAEDSPGCMAFLLNYKKCHYTEEQQEEADNIRINKELGLLPQSISDHRKSFLFKLIEEGVVITGYRGTQSEVVIPSCIGKNKVVAIGDYAFSPKQKRLTYYKKQIRMNLCSVTIPETVTAIGEGAFCDCTGIVSMTVPHTVKSIGTDAFKGCGVVMRMREEE